MLPKIQYSDGIYRKGQTEFGGYNHNPCAGDGAIFDCRNMSGRYYPAASSRPYRWEISIQDNLDSGYRSVYSHVHDNILYSVAFDFSGETGPAKLYKTDLTKTVITSECIADFEEWQYEHVTFAVIGNRLVIFPMGAVYDMSSGTFDYIDAVYNAPAGTIKYCSGEYGGVSAERNTLVTTGNAFPFRAGDCIVIEGACMQYNNVTAVIREISNSGKKLVFYENTFDWPSETESEYAETNPITISRKMPDKLEHCTCINGRLWACGGKLIAASALGDPYNWNVFDGTAADSWQTDEYSEGDFTACTSYSGYPVFFKPGVVIKVLGSDPSSFRTSTTAGRGVRKGASGTLAQVGGYLFWLSDIGVMYYSGGIPRIIGSELGNVHFKGGVAGSDGRRYFVSFHSGSAGSAQMFSYDIETGLWYREDNFYASSFSGTEILYAVNNYGDLVCIGDPPEDLIPPAAVKEEELNSSVTFTDFVFGSGDKKGVTKLQLRVYIADGGSLSVKIKYDSGDAFETVCSISGNGCVTSRYIPVVPRRCDHFTLMLEAIGEWRLQYIAAETYPGSAK